MTLSTLDHAGGYGPSPTATTEYKIEKKLTSTIMALTLCGSFGYVYTQNVPSYQPGFVETEHRVVERYEQHEIFLTGFDIESNSVVVGEYFTEKPMSLAFLSGVKSIIDQVYEGNVIRKAIRVLSDPDTDEPLMELVIQTDLPVDDNLLEKDRLIFEKIEQANLTEGLRHVVLSNG